MKQFCYTSGNHGSIWANFCSPSKTTKLVQISIGLPESASKNAATETTSILHDRWLSLNLSRRTVCPNWEEVTWTGTTKLISSLCTKMSWPKCPVTESARPNRCVLSPGCRNVGIAAGVCLEGGGLVMIMILQNILQRLRTRFCSITSLIALETDQTVSIPTARGRKWEGRAFCSRTTQLVRSCESLACLRYF